MHFGLVGAHGAAVVKPAEEGGESFFHTKNKHSFYFELVLKSDAK